MFNCENPVVTYEWTLVESNNCDCLFPTNNEIEQKIIRLKNQKSPGEERIQGYISKSLDEEKILRIYSVNDRVW